MRTRTVNREKARWRADIVKYCRKDEFCRSCFFASDDVCTWQMILLESVTSRKSFLVRKKLVDWVGFFFCFLDFSMVERCEWENERFCENNFDMACCWQKRTGNGIEIIVGRYSVWCFLWFYVDELTRISRMKWIDLVALLVFAANEHLFVIFTELFVGKQACAVQVNNEDKIEVVSIVRLVELTVLRQSGVECFRVILRRFKRVFRMKSLLCFFERIKCEFFMIRCVRRMSAETQLSASEGKVADIGGINILKRGRLQYLLTLNDLHSL